MLGGENVQLECSQTWPRPTYDLLFQAIICKCSFMALKMISSVYIMILLHTDRSRSSNNLEIYTMLKQVLFQRGFYVSVDR